MAVLMTLMAGGEMLQGQTRYIAYEVPYGTLGNQAIAGLGVGNDFCVVRPIQVWQLGVFTSGTNGIVGSTVLTVQLYERSGRREGTLLETLTFDAANPGTRSGGSFFKALPAPVTLLPGNYTIVAYGFDEANPEGNAGRPPYQDQPVLWGMNDGGGLIRFEGLSRYGGDVGNYPGRVDKGPANRYAAGNFVFSAATVARSTYAADYEALTAGVSQFPIEDTRHLGSLSVLEGNAFAVLTEHGGNRLVLEAAGTVGGNSQAGRAVAFAHVQWEQPFERFAGDPRLKLFENAIQWASRKSNPADIVMGITTNLNPTFMTNLDLGYFAGRGYRVVPFDFMKPEWTNALPLMDVVVVNGHARYLEWGVEPIRQFAARGGGVVMSMAPRFVVYPQMRPAFGAANDILQPYGLAYRSSLATPADLSFTNIAPVPPPPYFNARAAADLLLRDRKGEVHLDSLQKVTALNTITYAVHGKPQLLAQLTAIYAGASETIVYPGSAGDFVEVSRVDGTQADVSRLLSSSTDGSSLLTKDRRGSVDYTCTVPAADIYKVQLWGGPDATAQQGRLELVLILDGQRLGRFSFDALQRGMVECLTPYVKAGQHTLRITWDNPAARTDLRFRSVRFLTRLGEDSDGDGLKDWVEELLQQQSGLDLTNENIGSYTSPLCLEGRDPYLGSLELYVEGADSQAVNVNARPGPNGRWYANIPLSAFVNADTVLHASFQNGGLTQLRHLRWLSENLLAGQNLTIRLGDSLLFNAKPENAANGNLQITIGTNQLNGRTTQPIAYRFNQAGTFTVTGTYIPREGPPQSGSIEVKVVGQSFSNEPAAWVGKLRTWDVATVAPETVFEADNRLLFETTGAVAHDGVRTSLLIDQNEPRFILARLGTNGPVLASARVEGFKAFGAPDTYNRVLETYADGSRLVETLVMLSPVLTALPDVKVKLRVVVGGVTFEDGSTYRELSASDFDARGQYKLRFIMAASVRTANCHNITIVQGNEVVGAY
jgi:hypothetical protein